MGPRVNKICRGADSRCDVLDSSNLKCSQSGAGHRILFRGGHRGGQVRSQVRATGFGTAGGRGGVRVAVGGDGEDHGGGGRGSISAHKAPLDR